MIYLMTCIKYNIVDTAIYLPISECIIFLENNLAKFLIVFDVTY